jgi:hypothetical protein
MLQGVAESEEPGRAEWIDAAIQHYKFFDKNHDGLISLAEFAASQGPFPLQHTTTSPLDHTPTHLRYHNLLPPLEVLIE